ncbi:hypothetical protein [Planotetraspora mira]|uniref:Uncharacterized protein n=1 Tax=Planotetraspora mira TaxID=58121 RepID=A0A8J3XBJ1_9ACTN|nr:hypothetical protein [Planotetraspora mira]GII34641.1 hypothetical protein Pmi06nite_80830 [Planotetraspora mira]
MADYDIPADLLDARRAFDEAQAGVEAALVGLPSPVDIANQEAEISDEQQAEIDEARAAHLELTMLLRGHPWWKTVDNAHEAQMALQKAAKTTD